VDGVGIEKGLGTFTAKLLSQLGLAAKKFGGFIGRRLQSFKGQDGFWVSSKGRRFFAGIRDSAASKIKGASASGKRIGNRATEIGVKISETAQRTKAGVRAGGKLARGAGIVGATEAKIRIARIARRPQIARVANRQDRIANAKIRIARIISAPPKKKGLKDKITGVVVGASEVAQRTKAKAQAAKIIGTTEVKIRVTRIKRRLKRAGFIKSLESSNKQEESNMEMEKLVHLIRRRKKKKDVEKRMGGRKGRRLRKDGEVITLETFIMERLPANLSEEVAEQIVKGIADKAVKAALKAGRALQTKGGEKGFFFTRGGQKIFAAVKGKLKGAATRKGDITGQVKRRAAIRGAKKKVRGAAATVVAAGRKAGRRAAESPVVAGVAIGGGTGAAIRAGVARARGRKFTDAPFGKKKKKK